MKNKTMEITKKNKKVFLVLVPHRDVRSLLQKNSEEMIKAGLTGVYRFPHVAPLAELSKELSSDELKHTAQSLRDITKGEKMRIGETAAIAFPSNNMNMKLHGSRLDLIFPDSIFGDGIQKIKKTFSLLLIGSWLVPKTNERLLRTAPPPETALQDAHSNLSFRAAAIANMYWQPFQTEDDIGFKWKIGKLAWLPSR